MFKLSASDVDGNREPSASGSIRTNQFDKLSFWGDKIQVAVPLGVSKLTKNSRRLFPREIFFSTCQPPAISWPGRMSILKKQNSLALNLGQRTAANWMPCCWQRSATIIIWVAWFAKGDGQRGRRLYYWTIDSVESFGIVETCSTTAISYWEWQVVNQILSIEYRLRWSFLTEKLYRRISSCLPWWVAVYV